MSATVTNASDAPAPQPAPPAEPNLGIVESAQPGGKITRIEATPAPAGGEQRPTWLPEKFKSPEDLAKAYGEMERRMGALSHAQVPAPPAPVGQPAAAPASNPGGGASNPAGAPPSAPAAPQVSDLEGRILQEFAASGQVSEATRQAFTQRTGLSPAYIDQQLQYLQHQDQQARAIATQRVGGEAAVKELTDWAKGKLSAEERAAFNRMVYSGDPAQAQLAVDGLAAKFEAEVGRAPRIIAGRRPQGDYGGVVPFQNEHELAAAMRERDSRGKTKFSTDPAYREQVEARLEVAQRLGLIR